MYNFTSDKMYYLEFIIENLFCNYKNLTIKQISEILNDAYSIEEIYEAVDCLLVDKGIIVRDDYWSSDSIYRYVSYEYYQNSVRTKHYYSFNVDDFKNKKFLLISDTHIGNSELENYKMLHNIYEFSIQHGITKCFHMGDIFSGLISKNWNKDDILKQFFLFGKFYPNFDEIKTYALIGNHDEYINGFLDGRPLPLEYDLRQLTRYANNFYVIPRTFFDVNFSNININFSHKVFANWCNNKKKITCLDQICNLETFLISRCNVLISGHLHKGFICSNTFDVKNKLLIGVPSTTNININSVVAYIIELNYNDLGEIDDMNITLLLCDSNNKISKGETLYWTFKGKNKVLKKMV